MGWPDLQEWLASLFLLLATLGKALAPVIIAFLVALATKAGEKAGDKIGEEDKDPP